MIYRDKKALITALIQKETTVLDVGFWGQGLGFDDPEWPHAMLMALTNNVYGIDLDFDVSKLEHSERYFKANAEQFDLPLKFDVIFAGDIIEHLSNQGSFLASCSRNLKQGGVLILTTPNCFNLFNIAEKITKTEPTTNSDHTCYYNSKTLKKLLQKNGWEVTSIDFLYTLNPKFQESWKKKFLNLLYEIFSWWTPKFIETLVVVATPMKK